MVILQSHGTQNMILRCYPNVSAILRRHIYQILSPVLYVPLLIHRIFYLLVFALFLHALQYCIQAGALLRPKNGYLVWSRGVSSARMAQARNIAAAYFLSCRVQSAERVARGQLA